MLTKTRIGVSVGLFSLLTVLPIQAQEVATLAMKNGERPSGELVDMNASGFVLRIGGQERSFPTSDVRAVEFVVGQVSAEAQNKINAGQPFVIMRSGQLIDGRLTDVGGSRPLRLTIENGGGSRDINSNEVAQVWVNPAPSAASSGGSTATTPREIPANAITVPANVAWTQTGIPILRTRRLSFNSSGDIMLSPTASSGVNGSPAVTVAGARYPVRNAYAGVLIGKVGNNGTPFVIGDNTSPIEVRGTGTLMLGVNDDVLADNSGSYHVAITDAR